MIQYQYQPGQKPKNDVLTRQLLELADQSGLTGYEQNFAEESIKKMLDNKVAQGLYSINKLIVTSLYGQNK